MFAVEILGLEKTYKTGFWHQKQKIGLKNLSLEVPQGEVFGFLGPNGAGKTTTLKILMRLIFPSEGRALILGRDWRDAAVRSRIGFLPEQPYFYDHLTPIELLNYYGTLAGVSVADRRLRIPKLLERVGLADQGRVPLRKFSKGMLQRIGIAQAVLHEPEVVFLDEPMSGLDPVGRRDVRDFIASLNREGKTIFFSTHILSDAEALCDRVAVLNQGELRAVGVVSDLVAQHRSRFEVLWQGKSAIPAIEAFGTSCHAAGDVVRAAVSPDRLYALLDVLSKQNAQLISVSPAGGSLEQYFLERLNAPPAAARQ